MPLRMIWGRVPGLSYATIMTTYCGQHEKPVFWFEGLFKC